MTDPQQPTSGGPYDPSNPWSAPPGGYQGGEAGYPGAGYPDAGYPDAGYPDAGYAPPGYQEPRYQPVAYPPAPYGQPVAGRPYYPPPRYNVPPARPVNGLAIAAMVTSIMALFTCGLPVGLAGAIMGGIARRQIRERGESGDGMALAGVIIGWITFGIAMLIVLIYGVIILIGVLGGFNS